MSGKPSAPGPTTAHDTPPGLAKQATVLTDPAAALTPAERANRGRVLAARKAAWQRPATKAAQAAERQGRIDTVYAVYPALGGA